MGREREAGCDFNMGMSKREKAAMPPEAMNAVDMLSIWIVCVAADMAADFLVSRGLERCARSKQREWRKT